MKTPTTSPFEQLQLTNQEQAELIILLTDKVDEQAVIISNMQLTLDEQIEIIANLRLNLEDTIILINELNLKVSDNLPNYIDKIVEEVNKELMLEKLE